MANEHRDPYKDPTIFRDLKRFAKAWETTMRRREPVFVFSAIRDLYLKNSSPSDGGRTIATVWNLWDGVPEKLFRIDHWHDCSVGNRSCEARCHWLYRREAADLTRMRERERWLILDMIAPEVVEFIQNHSLELSAAGRELYADSVLVHPDHWVILADDSKRPVLNELARNNWIPLEAAEYILSKHSSASIREMVYRSMRDEAKLREIHESIKGPKLKAVIAENPYSGLWRETPNGIEDFFLRQKDRAGAQAARVNQEILEP